MPKSLTSLESHTVDIIEKRRKTQDARFRPLPTGVERVEDVIRQAVDYLGDRLAPMGFKAAPSRLTFSRKVGEITQVIALRADGANLSGVSVRVTANALVRSSAYKRWTGEHGTKYATEYLWVRQLGYLSGHHEHFKWELADPTTREGELSDLLSRIHSLALPAFEAWADKHSICRAVFRRTEADRIDWLMEIALWCGNSDVAKSLAEQHLRLRPQDVPEFMSELARFRADIAIGKPQGSPASGAAFLAARYKLAVTV
jgi:hypothetical protein